MANCNYKVKITDIQNKYRFKIFCVGGGNLDDYYTKEEVDALIPDLTDYVKNTNFASNSVGGVVKTSSSRGTQISNGVLEARNESYTFYSSASKNMIIGKGTLDNVLTAVIGDIETVLDTINGEVI